MKEKVTWWSIIRGAGYIVIFASLVGILGNLAFVVDVLQGEKTFSAEERTKEKLAQANILSVSLDEAKKAFDEKNAIFIDSRNEEEFALGHIPGAVNIPWEAFETGDSDFLDQIPGNMPLITYCGEDCESSVELALVFVELDYKAVTNFFNGWPSWVNANYPIAVEK